VLAAAVIEDHLTLDINVIGGGEVVGCIFIGGGEVVGFKQLWLALLASCSIGGGGYMRDSANDPLMLWVCSICSNGSQAGQWLGGG
jgi:hypothetical protein